MNKSRQDEGQYYGWAVTRKGGPGSGNWGHAGRKGQRGGSLSKSTAMSLVTGPTAQERQETAKGEKPQIAGPARAGKALFEGNQEASKEYTRRMDEWRPRYEANAEKMSREITTEGHKRQMMGSLLDKQVSALETAKRAQTSFVKGGRTNPGDFIKMTYWAAVSDLTGLLVRSLARLKVRQDVP